MRVMEYLYFLNSVLHGPYPVSHLKHLSLLSLLLPPSLLCADSVGATSSVVRSRWLRDLFESADKDSSGTLTMKEVLALVNVLNVSVSKKILKKMFKVSGSLV